MNGKKRIVGFAGYDEEAETRASHCNRDLMEKISDRYAVVGERIGQALHGCIKLIGSIVAIRLGKALINWLDRH